MKDGFCLQLLNKTLLVCEIYLITRVMIRALQQGIARLLRSNIFSAHSWRVKYVCTMNQHQLHTKLNNFMYCVENNIICSAKIAYTQMLCWHNSIEHIQAHYSTSTSHAEAWFVRTRGQRVYAYYVRNQISRTAKYSYIIKGLNIRAFPFYQ